jgi:hypothetical protein
VPFEVVMVLHSVYAFQTMFSLESSAVARKLFRKFTKPENLQSRFLLGIPRGAGQKKSVKV